MSDSWLIPPALRPGDLIGVAAPSGPVEPERLAAGVSALERMGFTVRVPDGLLARTGFTAGSVERRRAELAGLWRDPEVRAIVCARGGAGAIELLPALSDAELVLSDPKPLVGYSDVTFLHLLMARLGVISFHGPMVARGLDHSFDEASWTAALLGTGAPYSTPAGTLRSLRPGTAEGILLGGCLSILAAAAGTPWALRCLVPTILLIEDVGEAPYRLHRLLHQLRLAGAFENVTGIVFGEMTGCQDAAAPGALDDTLLAALEALGVPIAMGLPSGHTTGPAVTLPLGVPARLTCRGADAHLEMRGHGVQ